MINSTKVMVDRVTLYELVQSSIILDRLEAGGVDNWSYYSESYHKRGMEYVDDYDSDVEVATLQKMAEVAEEIKLGLDLGSKRVYKT